MKKYRACPIRTSITKRFSSTSKPSATLPKSTRFHLSICTTDCSDCSGEKPSLHFTDNGIHLNRYGYWVASQLIAEQLAPAPLWRVAVDGRAGSLIRAEGTEVVSLEVKGDDLELQIREQRLPAPASARSKHPSIADGKTAALDHYQPEKRNLSTGDRGQGRGASDSSRLGKRGDGSLLTGS
ncbi:MAG: hypothetical protein KatS3mg105_3779 [Gemmatales bacterium]|nr:MAG: hypothetical protein KatS3mg105_3779 [Gemmatales bacterium]